MPSIYRYHPQVLAQLAEHGVRPTAATRPELVKEFLTDLYRYELRRLRDRLMRRAIPKSQYAAHVVALRRQYWLISTPTTKWMECSQS